ncbi:ferritin-like domain-containing protein [Thiorhodovibrio winogradskyi]
MTQANLADVWGLREAADRFRHETVEEMRHAERIVKRMLGVGVVPNSSQLRPVTLAGNLVGLLRQNAVLEAEIVALYDEATRFCQSIDDGESAEFFQGLLNDEIAHAEEVDAWLKSLSGFETKGWNDRAYF